MGTNYAPLVADMFLFCYERDFMMFLSEEKQSEVIETFSSTSRYVGDLLHIGYKYFNGLIGQIYLSELQLNKANSSQTKAPFFDLHLSILDGLIPCKINDTRDDFNFEIVNFPFLYGDVPSRAFYDVNVSQLIRFARVSSHVADFNTRNKLLTAKLLNQSYRYHNSAKPFLNFIDVISI